MCVHQSGARKRRKTKSEPVSDATGVSVVASLRGRKPAPREPLSVAVQSAITLADSLRDAAPLTRDEISALTRAAALGDGIADYTCLATVHHPAVRYPAAHTQFAPAVAVSDPPFDDALSC